ncbi:MAG: tRNA lysidine(34) synthetase TilS, partial [Alphaproteobacteria bacterium]|nr:tRNA lysidine(34) synthetase TilS [Alphaproteobacteria bacterium]
HLLVAVSGGSDSMALTLLAAEWAAARDGQITAVTIDHQLRPESRAEADQVAQWLSQRKIEHHIISLGDVGLRDHSGNLAQNARHLRYAKLQDFVEKQGILHILLGHHQQDQAETFLQNLARGSGLDGLAAMSPISYRRQTRLLRPLLSVTKSRLQATLQARHQDWLEDSSNNSPKFERNRLRLAVAARQALKLSDARLALAADWCHKSQIVIEDEAAAIMAMSVTFLPPSSELPVRAMINAKIWAAAAAETRGRILADILMKIGGQDFRPRWQRVHNLEQKLCEYVEQAQNNPTQFLRFKYQLAGCEMMSVKPVKPVKPVKSVNPPQPILIAISKKVQL